MRRRRDDVAVGDVGGRACRDEAGCGISGAWSVGCLEGGSLRSSAGGGSTVALGHSAGG